MPLITQKTDLETNNTATRDENTPHLTQIHNNTQSVQKQLLIVSEDFALRSLVTQKPFQRKRATSIVPYAQR